MLALLLNSMRKKQRKGKRVRETGEKKESVCERVNESLFCLGYEHHSSLLPNSTYCACVLRAQKLAVDLCEFIERRTGNDGEDENKALSVLHVEIPHGCELFGTGCVENLEHALQSIHLDLFPIRVLDGGVVSVHKHRLYELNRLFKSEWCYTLG